MDAADLPTPRVAAARRSGRAAPPTVATRGLRTVSWRGHDDIALVVYRPGSSPPSLAEVRELLAAAGDVGITRLVTGALSPAEQAPFARAGFTVHDRLHLLSHDLVDLPRPPRTTERVRRARRGEHDAALAVDARAFAPFWRLDRAGLSDAIEATTSTRFRVVGEGPVVGYAVTGRSGARGYVQRLAVDPSRQREGLGAALVIDGLRWLRRRHATSAVVNTQLDNQVAFDLYRRLGFVPQPGGLDVLTRVVGEP